MSIDPPEWWNETLTAACIHAASQALPNEVCGLITAPVNEPSRNPGESSKTDIEAQSTKGIPHVSLHLFHGHASPTSVAASPDEVVRFAYQLQRENRLPIATFHSHPGGQMQFSERDEMLRMWARHHAVAVQRGKQWAMMFTS